MSVGGWASIPGHTDCGDGGKAPPRCPAVGPGSATGNQPGCRSDHTAWATAKDPGSRYVDAEELAADFRRAMQLDAKNQKSPKAEIYNPYKGLRPFQEGDARDFYGRVVLIGQLAGTHAGSGGYQPFPGRGWTERQR